jgi:hypothetical protein
MWQVIALTYGCIPSMQDKEVLGGTYSQGNEKLEHKRHKGSHIETAVSNYPSIFILSSDV